MTCYNNKLLKQKNKTILFLVRHNDHMLLNKMLTIKAKIKLLLLLYIIEYEL